MINNVIRTYHDAEKTVQGISMNYWFPSLRKSVFDYIDNCLICLMTNSLANSREGELQPVDNLNLFKSYTQITLVLLKKFPVVLNTFLLQIYLVRFT